MSTCSECTHWTPQYAAMGFCSCVPQHRPTHTNHYCGQWKAARPEHEPPEIDVATWSDAELIQYARIRAPDDPDNDLGVLVELARRLAKQHTVAPETGATRPRSNGARGYNSREVGSPRDPFGRLLLRLMGWRGALEDSWTTEMCDTVAGFQSHEGLLVDGKIGPDTLDALILMTRPVLGSNTESVRRAVREDPIAKNKRSILWNGVDDGT